MVDIAFAGKLKSNGSKISITGVPLGDMHSSGSNKRIKAVLSASYLTAYAISSGWTGASKSNMIIEMPTETVCTMNGLAGVDLYYIEAACRITHGVSQSRRVRSGEISAKDFCKFVTKNVTKTHDEIHISNSDRISDDSLKAIEYLLLGEKQKSLSAAVKDLLSSEDFVKCILCILESFESDKLGSFIRIDEKLDPELKEALEKDSKCPGWCSVKDAYCAFREFLKMDSAQITLNKVLRSIIDKKIIEGNSIKKNLSKKEDVLNDILRFSVFINAVSKSLSEDPVLDGLSMSLSSETIREMVGMNRTKTGKQGLMVFAQDALPLAEKIASHYGAEFQRSDDIFFSSIRSKDLLITYASFSDPSVLSIKSKSMLKAMGNSPYRCILDTDPLSDEDMKYAIDCISDGLYMRRPEEIMAYDDDVRNCCDTRTIFENKIGTIIPHWFEDKEMNELGDMIRKEAGDGVEAAIARCI